MMDVPAPIELYDALHAGLLKIPAPAMLLHLGRATDEGFQPGGVAAEAMGHG